MSTRQMVDRSPLTQQGTARPAEEHHTTDQWPATGNPEYSYNNNNPEYGILRRGRINRLPSTGPTVGAKGTEMDRSRRAPTART